MAMRRGRPNGQQIGHTTWSTRSMPAGTLQFARVLAKVRGVSVERMVADALEIGLESWATALTNAQVDRQKETLQ